MEEYTSFPFPENLFHCIGFECDNKSPKEFEGKICNTCYEKNHTNDPKETCICQRCEKNRNEPVKQTNNNQYIVTDPEFIMDYSDWETKGSKYITDQQNQLNPIPFTSKDKKENQIIILTIKQTQGNRSELILKPDTIIKTNSYYMCIAKSETNWNENKGSTHSNLEEAKEALEIYIKRL